MFEAIIVILLVVLIVIANNIDKTLEKILTFMTCFQNKNLN
jgi:hypothetical protein